MRDTAIDVPDPAAAEAARLAYLRAHPVIQHLADVATELAQSDLRSSWMFTRSCAESAWRHQLPITDGAEAAKLALEISDATLQRRAIDVTTLPW